MGEEGKLQSVYKINGKMLIKLKKRMACHSSDVDGGRLHVTLSSLLNYYIFYYTQGGVIH